MSLAAERTYLAYVRTGLALTAAGVAVAAALPNAHAVGLRRGLGLVLVLLGALMFGFARPRWSQVTRAVERGESLPPARIITPLAIALLLAAAAAATVVFLA
jgi:putative membrane protein